ncbi:putative POTRA domain-containing protein [Gammaproteobacteria bacterium]
MRGFACQAYRKALLGGAFSLLAWGDALPSGPGFGSRSSLPEPDFQNLRPAPAMILPPVPPPESSRLASGPVVLLQEVRFEGNQVFSDAQLAAVVAPDLGRTLTAEDLQAIRHRLTRFYIDHGYISSGVVLPDQELVDGLVHFRVIEGKISGVQVSGHRRLQSRFIEQGLLPDPAEVLNIQKLQDRVLLLHQDPAIERVLLEVVPGLRQGEASLSAEVTEANPWHWQIEANNYRSPDVGSEQGVLTGGFSNLTGHADALQVAYAHSQGLDDVSADYDFPLGSRTLAVTLAGEYIDARVISPAFKKLDIESQSRRFNVGLRYFPVRRPDIEFKLGLKLEWADSRVSQSNEPFAFPDSGSSDNGNSSVAAVRFTQEWSSRSPDQVLAARSIFSLGLDAFGSTIRSHGPDSRFLSWMGELQWAWRFGENRRYQQIARAMARFSDDTLLPLERFSLAGPNTVRGYREGLLVRDDGWLVSLEFRAPLTSAENGWQSLQVAPFIDLGQTWNKSESHESLDSAGVGLRWQPTEQWQANLYYGVPLGDIRHPTNTLQDHGVLFQVSNRF